MTQGARLGAPVDPRPSCRHRARPRAHQFPERPRGPEPEVFPDA